MEAITGQLETVISSIDTVKMHETHQIKVFLGQKITNYALKNVFMS